MITRYPELQSGFVSYPSERLLERPNQVPMTPIGALLSAAPNHPSQEYFFSKEVEGLYSELLNNPFLLSDFEFQSRVFQIAGVLFDRKGILSWMRIQEEGRHISMMHRLFLEDTLRVITLRTPRLHSPDQWVSMISISNKPLIKPFRASQVTEAVGFRPSDDLSENLADWVTNSGLADLVMSLRVIFGRRSAQGLPPT